ncbi:alpha/beta hydrolase [Levilactobacillus bambusae]|uniref:Acyltransferase n=1 Tax=Levilactobacillus bambusae TaxID=2024736 RepID=A0A2V1MYT8_9LACO|nr:alpha/beta hydrolase [Levilactobacillus bambusae]PWG00174.1 acyltransferase [Levilactobacillus bambusae]
MIVIATLVVVIPSVFWMRSNVASLKETHKSALDPIIMVPGSSASQNRFDSLITALKSTQRTTPSVLKVYVHSDGQLSYTGSIRQGDNHPYIVIAFQNNKDGYSNVNLQAKWLSTAFAALVESYHFNHFAAMGHSNGGLIWTLFLERYFRDNKDVNIDRLMTLATPYNMESTSTTYESPMLKELIKYRSGLPKSLTVYSVAGTENYSDDGIVPYNSVNQGKYIFQNQVKHFTQITVTGVNTQHSDLPQNKQIVSLLRQYLLQDGTKADAGKEQSSDSTSK